MKNWIKLNYGIQPIDVREMPQLCQEITKEVKEFIDKHKLNDIQSPLGFMESSQLNPKNTLEDMTRILKLANYKKLGQKTFTYAVNYSETWISFENDDHKITFILSKDSAEDHLILISDIELLESELIQVNFN